jgi:hypothetical protein
MLAPAGITAIAGIIAGTADTATNAIVEASGRKKQMRKTLVALAAALAIGASGALMTTDAQAASFGASAGLRGAAETLDLADEVRHRCFRTRYGWRCPPHGWRRYHWRPRYRAYRRWY